MKTLNTFLVLSLLMLSSSAFARLDGTKDGKKSNVSVAPSVWETGDIDIPQSLKFIKAKNAFVPVAAFVWGTPSEVPAQLLVIPLAPFVYGDPNEIVPQQLGYIKARFALVPVAPFTWGDPVEDTDKLSTK